MSINEKDMSFFFFYKRRASFYQGNLNFVTTNVPTMRCSFAHQQEKTHLTLILFSRDSRNRPWRVVSHLQTAIFFVPLQVAPPVLIHGQSAQRL